MIVQEYKFKLHDGDYDYSVSHRIISGKFTKQRRKKIEKIVRKYNYIWSAPYGRSSNGYAYTCGCTRDCCGCISSKGMHFEFHKSGNNHIAILSIGESYNY
jgi:hypothetical protein